SPTPSPGSSTRWTTRVRLPDEARPVDHPAGADRQDAPQHPLSPRSKPGLRRQSARPARPSVVGRRFLLLCPVVAAVAGRGARISRAGRGPGTAGPASGADPGGRPGRGGGRGPAPPPAVLDGGQGGPDFFRRA